MDNDEKRTLKLMQRLRKSDDVDLCLHTLREIADIDSADTWDAVARNLESWNLSPAAMVASVRYNLDEGDLDEAYYVTNSIVQRLIAFHDEPWPAEGIDCERWGVENHCPDEMGGVYACIYMTHFKVMAAGEAYLRKKDAV